jgi:hypothetical protein
VRERYLPEYRDRGRCICASMYRFVTGGAGWRLRNRGQKAKTSKADGEAERRSGTAKRNGEPTSEPERRTGTANLRAKRNGVRETANRNGERKNGEPKWRTEKRRTETATGIAWRWPHRMSDRPAAAVAVSVRSFTHAVSVRRSVRSVGSLFWFAVLVRCSGSLFWFAVLVRCSGSLFWFAV